MAASAQFNVGLGLDDVALLINKVHIPRNPDRSGPRVYEDLWVSTHGVMDY